MIKLRWLVGVTMLVLGASGCSQTGSITTAERPAQLIQADRLMARGEQSFQQGQLHSAARQYRRAEATYAAFDQREHVHMARLNKAQVRYQQGIQEPDYMVRACALLWPADTDAEPRSCQPAQDWEAVQQAYPDVAVQAASLTVRLLASLGESPQTLLDTMPEQLIETRLTRLWLNQRQLHDAEGRTQFEHALQAALATADEAPYRGSVLLHARLLRYQAQLAIAREDYEQADILLQQALALYREEYHRIGIAMSLQELTQVHEKLGNMSEADEYLERADVVWGQRTR